jgi:hypothetical protein
MGKYDRCQTEQAGGTQQGPQAAKKHLQLGSTFALS